MTYPPDHKRRTRERILSNARRLFRENGYHEVGIDAVMSASNLTRGGFYAHFASKDDLFREVVEQSTLLDILRDRPAEMEMPARLCADLIFDIYLSRWHRDDPGAGCNVAALSNSVRTAPEDVRAAYTRLVREVMETVAPVLSPDGDRQRERAIGALAMAIGAILVARAVNDEALSTEILLGARRMVDVVGWSTAEVAATAAEATTTTDAAPA